MPLAAVIWRAEGLGPLRASDWAALRFTLAQAAVSAALSVALAIPVARALARRAFPGRGAVIVLLGAPFILPTIVAVLGLVAVFGRSGLIAQATGLRPDIYGAHGVVLAHVFFNLPLAVRLILQGWLTVPAERFRLAASLGFSARDTFRTLELPMLRAVVPGVALVIFLICTTSFAVALALGGGPRSTTVELAIYQAFRFDFDLARAASLACIQLALGIGAAAIALRLALPSGQGEGLDRAVERWDSAGWRRALDAAAIALACAFLVTPMAVLAARGAPHVLDLPASVWAAAGRSLAIALAASVATAALALPMALASAAGRAWVEVAGMIALSASPLVLGVGLFVLVLPWADPAALALPVVGAVNVVLALPFALRALLPAVRELREGYGRLSESLGIRGRAWLRLVALPRLARPLGYAMGLTAALSAGDLGVIALFSRPGEATLPLALYQLMGSYRMDAAMAAALVLIALSLGLFWAFDRMGRRADA